MTIYNWIICLSTAAMNTIIITANDLFSFCYIFISERTYIYTYTIMYPCGTISSWIRAHITWVDIFASVMSLPWQKICQSCLKFTVHLFISCILNVIAWLCESDVISMPVLIFTTGYKILSKSLLTSCWFNLLGKYLKALGEAR